MIIINQIEKKTFGIITILNMKLTVIEIETYQLKEYLDKIKPYLSDIIIDLQNSDTWKVLSTIAINFIFLRDAEEEHVMH